MKEVSIAEGRFGLSCLFFTPSFDSVRARSPRSSDIPPLFFLDLFLLVLRVAVWQIHYWCEPQLQLLRWHQSLPDPVVVRQLCTARFKLGNE